VISDDGSYSQGIGKHCAKRHPSAKWQKARHKTGSLASRSLGFLRWCSIGAMSYHSKPMRRIGTSCINLPRPNSIARGDVGIWHETYLVKAGQYESIYSSMPPMELGIAGALQPASGHREAARGRLLHRADVP